MSLGQVLNWSLNLAVLALAATWLWRRTGLSAGPELRRWFWLGLGLRLAGGALLGWFYAQPTPPGRLPYGDSPAVQFLADGLTEWSARQPAAYLRALTTGGPPSAVQLPRTFYRATPAFPYAPFRAAYFIPTSNSWFFARLLSLLNWLTGSSYWLNGLWLSLASFAGSWLLLRALTGLVPQARWGALLGCVAWPSLVFWAAGVSKDGLTLAALGVLTAAALRLIFQSAAGRTRLTWWIALLSGAWFFWRIKFFVAAVAFVALGALAVALAVRARWPRVRPVWLLAALLVGLAPTTRLLHRAFRPEYARQQIVLNQRVLAATIPSGQPSLALPLTPSLSSFTRYAPVAVGGVFTRPWLWEGAGWRWRLVGLENTALLLLIAWALARWWRRGHSVNLPLLAGALGFFVLIVSAMLGLTTPNLGSLHRYRVVLWPFSLWLLDWLRVGGGITASGPLGSRGRSSQLSDSPADSAGAGS